MQTNRNDPRDGKRAKGLESLAPGALLDARYLYWYIGAVTAALFIVIGAAAWFSRAPLVAPGPIQAAAAATGSRPSGQFLRRLPDGHTCRYTVFDNNLGQASQDKLGRCEEIVPPPTLGRDTAASKLDIHSQKFSWGGR